MSGQIRISKLYLAVLYSQKPRSTSPPAIYQTVSRRVILGNQAPDKRNSRQLSFRQTGFSETQLTLRAKVVRLLEHHYTPTIRILVLARSDPPIAQWLRRIRRTLTVSRQV